jgi:hypothetical protein
VFFSVIVRVSPEISKRADAATESLVSALMPDPVNDPALQGALARHTHSAAIPAATEHFENQGFLI